MSQPKKVIGLPVAMNSSVPPPFTYDRLGNTYGSSGRDYYRDYYNFTPDQIWQTYTQEGLLQRIVDKEANKLFSKWFVVATPDNPDSDLPRQVNSAMNQFNMREKFPQVERSKILFGAGWFFHELADIKNKDELVLPIGNKVSADKYMDIAPMSKIMYLETKRNDDLYATTKYYSFKVGGGVSTKKTTGTSSGGSETWDINPQRLIIVKNDPFGCHPEGMSEILGAMNHLDNLRNILWMLETGLMNRTHSIPIVKHPNNITSEDRDSIMTAFKDPSAKDVILIPVDPNNPQNNIDVIFNTNFADWGNIEPLIDMVMKLFSTTAGLPYALLFGTPSGGLSGSEMNSREYLSNLSAKLNAQYTPVVQKIIDAWRKFGVIDNQDDEYEIVWQPLYEMTEEEEKRILFLESNRSVNYWKMGRDHKILPSGFIDGNSIGPSTIPPTSSNTQVINPKERAAEIRNPDDEAVALMNNLVKAKDSDELHDATQKMLNYVDTVRNELAGVPHAV